MLSKKIIFRIILILLTVTGVIAYNFYQKIYGDNVLKSGDLFISSKDDFTTLKQKITPFLNDVSTFVWISNQKRFTTPKPGRYIITENMSNNDIVNKLRIGEQTPVKISFNNQDTLEKFAGRISEQLDIDSIAVINSFTDRGFLDKNGFTKKSVLQICIPNTYEFYWTVKPNKFRDRLLREYNRFWTTARLEKAKALKMTKNEVITLASIVQKETAKKVERPIVAGLYLNRLKEGWPLQADPTIIYAIKEVKGEDFIVKRVLKVDLEINSPYNTYKNRGLPPTQISMPDISSIDAVLNADKHSYFYMCANIDKIGYHKFARTLAQHNRNAAKYQNWLNKKGVNR
ncbi:endolytic transglycosylase MltG [Polaribacter porphyrae]|uniref:Endolytic murein transglycosylase n=1 Tax=Polaribacter porphyrae TaxID=1137780 RepID=A0A2S7WME4_9FLAO|nr:endolytic transglycosylase MltG [Polaribacter porphyrae]PQJ78787.1 aminodeoxychorismate lyase [Polaribacter porphyrae]